MIALRRIWDSLAISTNGIVSRFNLDKIQFHQVSFRLMVELPQTPQMFLVTLQTTRYLSLQLAAITPNPTKAQAQLHGLTITASIGPPPPLRPTASAAPCNGPRASNSGSPSEPTALTSAATTARPGSRSTTATGMLSRCPSSSAPMVASPGSIRRRFQPGNEDWNRTRHFAKGAKNNRRCFDSAALRSG